MSYRDPQEMVAEFHDTFGLTQADRPKVPGVGLADVRIGLIEEEFEELDAACRGFEEPDLVAIADALADLVYVAYGFAVACGIDLRPILAEVHRSNMTKTRGEGHKPLKGQDYSAPDLLPLLQAQGYHDNADLLEAGEEIPDEDWVDLDERGSAE